MSTTTVTAFIGPQGSGKTHRMAAYADSLGIDFFPVRYRWESIRDIASQIFQNANHYAITKGHLFIDDYPINDRSANEAVHSFCTLGIKVLIATQEEPTVPLPDSFEIVRVRLEDNPWMNPARKEVRHA